MTYAEACVHLATHIKQPGHLDHLGDDGRFIWLPLQGRTIELEGEFTADDLEALAVYMRQYMKEE